MELSTLEGNIIGIVSRENNNPDYEEKLVSEIIINKLEDSLKMVNLDPSIADKKFSDLSSMDKNKIILASQLQQDKIILYDFSKGMLKKDLSFFKRLFKKIVTYGKKIYLYSKDAELFINCVDNIYILNEDEIVFKTNDIFDPTLYIEMETPGIVRFIYKCEDLGIHLDEYTDINELIKAIYRIKS